MANMLYFLHLHQCLAYLLNKWCYYVSQLIGGLKVLLYDEKTEGQVCLVWAMLI